MNIDEWLEYGMKQGFVSDFCYLHDLPPMTDEEADDYYDSGDPCIPVLRVWTEKVFPGQLELIQ